MLYEVITGTTTRIPSFVGYTEGDKLFIHGDLLKIKGSAFV